MIRYHARFVVPVSAPPIVDGTVAVDADRIAYVGPRAGAPAGPDHDLGHVVLLPGLVNAHCHLELTAMRGFLEELDFRSWILRLTTAKRAVLTRDAMLDAARYGIDEGLLHGVTTFADTCDSGVAFDAMLERRVRGIMYQEVFGPDPAESPAALAALRVKIQHMRPRETALVKLGVSPHAPYTVSDALFAAVATDAREASLPMAVHIAESEVEEQLVTSGTGAFADGLRARAIAANPRARSSIQLLRSLGVLAAQPLLIHCIRTDANDIATIAAARCGVAHCPVSNAKLGHGIAPLLEMLAAGIPVGLGSDSMASNNRMDLLGEARFAVLLQRARLGTYAGISSTAALELATISGARAIGFDRETGSLEVGKAADLAAFALRDAAPATDPETASIFALAGSRASFVAVAGRVLVCDGHLLDEDRDLADRVQRTGEALAVWLATEGRTAVPA